MYCMCIKSKLREFAFNYHGMLMHSEIVKQLFCHFLSTHITISPHMAGQLYIILPDVPHNIECISC